MKIAEDRGDMIVFACPSDTSGGAVLKSLETLNESIRQPCEETVAVIDLRHDEGVDQLFP